MIQEKYESLKKLCETFNEKMLLEDLYQAYRAQIENKKEIYIWGAGQFGKFAYSQFKKAGWDVLAFIDNNTDLDGEHLFVGGGKWVNIISPDMVEPGYTIVICTKYFPEIEMQIKNELSNPCLFYGVFSVLRNDIWREWDSTLLHVYKKMDVFRDNYISVFEKCADNLSKKVLDCILKYRFTMKSEWLKEAYALTCSYAAESSKEYFDTSIMYWQRDEVFVDCGGYIGDTVVDFLEFSKNAYKRIYFLEPNPEIYKKAKNTLKNVHDIDFIPAGAGESAGTFLFSGDGDSGHLDINGNESISVVALDEVVTEKPTFIKMDIEGAEKSALLGAKKIIKQHMPKLAICVYHKPEDIFEILELIDSWEIEYNYYFRHYSKGISGTILYCIPQNK